MTSLSVRITSVAEAAVDIRQLTLASVDGSLLPPYEPGAHIDVHLGPGLVRQYSLCGEYGDHSKYTIAVKLEANSRGGSRAAHESLTAGSALQISAPRNNFPLVADAGHSLLVAGGIGITPLISMARALHAKGRSFEFVAFSRSPRHAAFRNELESGPLAPSSRLLFGLSREDTAQALRSTLAKRMPNGHAYFCGPTQFMVTAQELAREAGWREDAVHVEHFSPVAAPAKSTDSGFQVCLARTGTVIWVAPNETIVDALRAQGVDVETSCEQGVCGTCVTTVVAGSLDHRDCFLTPQERAGGACVALCVSRSLSPLLVLDL